MPASEALAQFVSRRLARLRDRLFRCSRTNPVQSKVAVNYRKVLNMYVNELRFAQLSHQRFLGQQLSNESLTDQPHRWGFKIKSACGWSTSAAILPLSFENMLHLHPIDKAEDLNRSFAAPCSAPTAPRMPSLPKSKDSLHLLQSLPQKLCSKP